jgi:polysaccharide export outer membrane protein
MNRTKILFVLLLLTPVCLLAQNSQPAASVPDAPKTLPSSAPVGPVATSQPSPKEGTADDYVIGPSDQLVVTVWKEASFSGTYLVRPDGMISIPLVGDIQASGLTATQLGNQIAIKLKKFMQDPNVTVLISQIHSKVIYLLGEVMKKGPVEMTAGMTLLQAVSSAGGMTDFANTKKMYILRMVGGKQTSIPLHYKLALKGDGAENLTLQPGDTIVVP